MVFGPKFELAPKLLIIDTEMVSGLKFVICNWSEINFWVGTVVWSEIVICSGIGNWSRNRIQCFFGICSEVGFCSQMGDWSEILT